MRQLLPILLLSLSTASAGEWHTFTDVQGRTVEAMIVSTDLDGARVVLKSTGRNAYIRLEQLIPSDAERVRSWKPGSEPAQDEALFPRSRPEIERSLKEIRDREPPVGVDRSVQRAVNELNGYRYLSGLPGVEADPDLSERARMAAETCEEQGKLSHGLGNGTDKCNLTLGRRNLVEAVEGFMKDAEDNNRVARGHRRWCLEPRMGKTGFGEAGPYMAMWVMDDSGDKTPRSWMYPGRGHIPAEWMLDKGWSYFRSGRIKGPVAVEVTRLARPPESAFDWDRPVPGDALEVSAVHVIDNAVNFEVENLRSRGTYWIRIRGKDFREQYVVDLY